MMLLSSSAREVVLDASPLCHFARHGLLGVLRAYLGARARITREVERELLRLAETPEFAPLKDYLAADGEAVRMSGKWPRRTGQLATEMRADFVNLLALAQTIGEHERAHAGEIATVLMAQHRGADLLIMDDRCGRLRRPASRCGIPCVRRRHSRARWTRAVRGVAGQARAFVKAAALMHRAPR